MYKLIAILAVLGFSNAQHWNNPNWAVGPPAPVQDTPEVAAAKAAHFAAVSRVQPQQHQAQPQWNQGHNQWNAPQPQGQWNSAPQPQGRYQGPLALPPGFDQNGAPLPVQDTAEVAAERARHFNLVGGFGAPQGHNQWNPAPAQNQWNAQPQQWNAQPQQWNAQPQQWNAQPQQWNAQPQQWNTHQAQQPGLPADTPEVAAAKAAHLAAHAQLHHGRRRRSAIVAAAPIAYTLPALLPTARYIHAPTLLAAHW